MARLWMARQGDVLLIEVDTIPGEALAHPRPADAGRVVLAYGEVTGHAHTLDADAVTAYGPSDDAFWVRVDRPGAVVIHEEHAPIVIPERVRTLRVVRQQEYSAAGARRVQD